MGAVGEVVRPLVRVVGCKNGGLARDSHGARGAVGLRETCSAALELAPFT